MTATIATDADPTGCPFIAALDGLVINLYRGTGDLEMCTWRSGSFPLGTGFATLSAGCPPTGFFPDNGSGWGVILNYWADPGNGPGAIPDAQLYGGSDPAPCPPSAVVVNIDNFFGVTGPACFESDGLTPTFTLTVTLNAVACPAACCSHHPPVPGDLNFTTSCPDLPGLDGAGVRLFQDGSHSNIYLTYSWAGFGVSGTQRLDFAVYCSGSWPSFVWNLEMKLYAGDGTLLCTWTDTASAGDGTGDCNTLLINFTSPTDGDGCCTGVTPPFEATLTAES